MEGPAVDCYATRHNSIACGSSHEAQENQEYQDALQYNNMQRSYVTSVSTGWLAIQLHPVRFDQTIGLHSQLPLALGPA